MEYFRNNGEGEKGKGIRKIRTFCQNILKILEEGEKGEGIKKNILLE